MKVRLKFDHPHSYREWDAWEIQPGLVQCTSELRIKYSSQPDYVQEFTVVVAKEQVEEIK